MRYNMYKQEPPFCIQVEMTHGCPLKCPFCAVAYYEDREYKFMSVATAELFSEMLADSGWNPRIEFAMHGEPTMNPEWENIIKAVRKNNPKLSILMLTNGYQCQKGHLRDVSERFFAAGGNTLGIDMYHGKISENIAQQLDNEDNDFAFSVCRFYDGTDPNENPHKRYNGKRVIFIGDIRNNSRGTHSQFENHAGVSMELDTANQNKPCVKPFREMGICYDGGVNVCCCDFLNEALIGNIHNCLELDEIWNSELMMSYRRMLLSGERIHRPCKGCSAVGYRTGLLPDKLGKHKKDLGEYSEKDDINIIGREKSEIHKVVKSAYNRLKDILE